MTAPLRIVSPGTVLFASAFLTGCAWISDAELDALRTQPGPSGGTGVDDEHPDSGESDTNAPLCDPVYTDSDHDGFGAGAPLTLEAPDCLPSGYAERAGDCDDATDAVHPEAAEVCGDAVDNDCSGLADACGFSESGRIDTLSGAIIQDVTRGQGLGGALAASADLNGDGVLDLIVGQQPTASVPGEVWVFAGGPDLADADVSLEPSDATASWVGSSTWRAGAAVGAIPAGVRGDYGAVLVGAPFFTDVETHQGAVFLMDGPPAGTGLVGADFSVVFSERQANLHVGGSEIHVGDIEGDGTVDLLLTVAETSSTAFASGAAWIVRGGAHIEEGTVDLEAMATRITAPSAAPENAYLGKAAALCDIDGDGGTEVVVGAPQRDAGIGMVGFLEEIPEDTLSLDAFDHVWTSTWGERLGESFACGDFDGDGTQDIAAVMVDDSVWRVAMALEPTISTDPAGASYLYADGVASETVTVTRIPASPGEDTDSLFICYSSADAPEGSGLAFVHPGAEAGATNLLEAATATIHGGATTPQFCSVAAGSLDLTGDGLSDLAVGGYRNTDHGFGQVWMLPGFR